MKQRCLALSVENNAQRTCLRVQYIKLRYKICHFACNWRCTVPDFGLHGWWPDIGRITFYYQRDTARERSRTELRKVFLHFNRHQMNMQINSVLWTSLRQLLRAQECQETVTDHQPITSYCILRERQRTSIVIALLLVPPWLYSKYILKIYGIITVRSRELFAKSRVEHGCHSVWTGCQRQLLGQNCRRRRMRFLRARRSNQRICHSLVPKHDVQVSEQRIDSIR